MRLFWISAAAAAVVLTLAFASPYGILNQATYLLDPLHRAHPELFHRDWFVSETPPYLPVFGWMTSWLYHVDTDGAVAFITAHVLVTIASWLAIAWLVDLLGGTWRAFVPLAAYVAFTMNIAMGHSYLVTGYFQPSSLATLGWLVAMAALASDRFLLCGIAAAFAGAVHANFLVLGVGLFGLAALARRDMTWRELARVMMPQLIVLACFLPTLLQAAGPNHHQVWILTHFHAPVHYAPDRLDGWYKNMLCWLVGGYAGYYLLREYKPARVLWRFALVGAAVVIASGIVISIDRFESLTQVRWSRIAPFAVLACQVLMVSGVVRQTVEQTPLPLHTRVLVALGLIVPVWRAGRYLHSIVSPTVTIAAAALLVAPLVPWSRIARAATFALAGVALVYALWRSPRGHGLTTRPFGSDGELALAHWARAETPVDALFLAPPDLMRFRLFSHRAVVVDTKSPPLRPDLLEAWYQRLCAMVLYPDAPTFRSTEARYAELTQPQLEQVARTFSTNYIVVRGVEFDREPVYRNDEFTVYRVP